MPSILLAPEFGFHDSRFMSRDTAPIGRVRRLARPVSSPLTLLPGLIVCGAASFVAMIVNTAVPTLNPLLIAIVGGALLANMVQVPERLAPGLQFSAKRLLRVGIALLGLRLMIGDIVALGWGVTIVVAGVVVLGITGTMLVGRLMSVPPTQRILIACGFSICGAAAVAATDGIVNAKEKEVITAIALVVLFGTTMIAVIPLMAETVGMSGREAGIWIGASIHEVAQVVAAGGAVGGEALAVAVTVKLGRVLMLAPVMSVLSLQQRRRPTAVGVRRPPLVPLFVVAFMLCVAVRSAEVVPASVIGIAHVAETGLLAAAMFALGAGVRLATLRRVGCRPLVLAVVSTIWIAAVAWVGVAFVN